MGQIDVIAPSGPGQNGGWTVTGAATRWEALEDSSDSSYVSWASGSNALIFAMDSHTPPSGMRRHLSRVIYRGQSGTTSAAIFLASQPYLSPSAAAFGGSIATANGSWGTGAPVSGPADFLGVLLAQTAGVRVMKFSAEIDCREQPVFTPVILDGVGNPSVNLTDTSLPIIRLDAVDLDGLPFRYGNARIEDASSNVVWSGPVSTTTTTTTNLPNGTYTLYVTIASTINNDQAFESVEEEVEFDINTTPISEPDSAEASIGSEPFVNLAVDITTALTEVDTGTARIQVRRTDCNGTTVIIDSPATSSPVELVDYSAPRSLTGTNCPPEGYDCPFSYEVRVLGFVGALPAVSDWSPFYTASIYFEDSFPGSSLDPSKWVDVNPSEPVIVSGGRAIISGPSGWTGMRAVTTLPVGPFQVVVTITTSSFPPAPIDYLQSSLDGPSGAYASIAAWTTGGDDVLAAYSPGEYEETPFEPLDVVWRYVYTDSSVYLYSGPSEDNLTLRMSSLEDFSAESYFNLEINNGRDSGDWSIEHVKVETISMGGDLYLYWNGGEHLLRAMTPEGPIFASVCGTLDWGVERPFTVSQALTGGQQVKQGGVGGKDFTLTTSVNSQEALEDLEKVLEQPLILVSPSDTPSEQWSAPIDVNVDYVKVGRIRSVGATMQGTGPEPVI